MDLLYKQPFARRSQQVSRLAYGNILCNIVIHNSLMSLPAATKLGQGNIFTSVCLSTEGWGEGCLPQCMLGYPPDQAQDPPEQAHPLGGRHPTPPDQTHTPGPGTPPPPNQAHPPPRPGPPPPPWEADCSIRLTSSRYASYWNAFLFII